MDQASNPQRMDAIFRMLLEMAGGNFNGQLPATGADDGIEALSVLVNMLAEELKASVFHTGFINPRFTYRYLIHAAFLLDEHFIVQGFNPHVPKFLGYSPPSLYRRPFGSLLSPSSQSALRLVEAALGDDPDFSQTLECTFHSGDGLEIPVVCTVSRFLYTHKILISSLSLVVDDHPPGEDPSPEASVGGMTAVSAAQLAQRVYDYILEHLDGPMLPAKELARLFGSNEFTLKHSFKNAFQTSIYKCYNSERLKRAYLLVRETAIPLKTISETIGFNTYPNFSKAFRKAYGCSPAEARGRPDGPLKYS